MITITDARIQRGYTGYDHLIDSGDERTVSGFIGRQFRSAKNALDAVERAYLAGCDRRVNEARITLTVRLASGEERQVRS